MRQQGTAAIAAGEHARRDPECGTHRRATRARITDGASSRAATGSSRITVRRAAFVNAYAYRGDALHVEAVDLRDIATRFGTPCYVYSRSMLEAAYRAYDNALAAHPHLVCYAAKANSNLAVLDTFARLGSGFDIVSGGELARVIAAGGDPRKVVFSGVGKTFTEMEAALDANILCFNVESASELAVLDAAARRRGRRAPISVRVNPDVDPLTHRYIATGLSESKFGVSMTEARELYRHAARLGGIAVHGI